MSEEDLREQESRMKEAYIKKLKYKKGGKKRKMDENKLNKRFITVIATKMDEEFLRKIIKDGDKLKKENNLKELVENYSLLELLCGTRYNILIEKEDVNSDEVNKWKEKSKHYNKLKKDVLLEINRKTKKFNEKDEIIEIDEFEIKPNK